MPCRSATLSSHYLRSDPSPLSPASAPGSSTDSIRTVTGLCHCALKHSDTNPEAGISPSTANSHDDRAAGQSRKLLTWGHS